MFSLYILKWVETYICNSKSAVKVKGSFKNRKVIKWQAPKTGEFKINTDAALVESNGEFSKAKCVEMAKGRC